MVRMCSTAPFRSMLQPCRVAARAGRFFSMTASPSPGSLPIVDARVPTADHGAPPGKQRWAVKTGSLWRKFVAIFWVEGKCLETDSPEMANGGEMSCYNNTMISFFFQRSGAVGACRAHNPEVVGSKPTFATEGCGLRTASLFAILLHFQRVLKRVICLGSPPSHFSGLRAKL